MAATLGPSGWWWRRCRWRWRLSAWDGSRVLLLLLLLGSGQTFEYLKREHSLSKPYQGEAPGTRWSCMGRASGPESLGRGGRRRASWPGPCRRWPGAHGDSRGVWELRVRRAGVSRPPAPGAALAPEVPAGPPWSGARPERKGGERAANGASDGGPLARSQPPDGVLEAPEVKQEAELGQNLAQRRKKTENTCSSPVRESC